MVRALDAAVGQTSRAGEVVLAAASSASDGSVFERNPWLGPVLVVAGLIAVFLLVLFLSVMLWAVVLAVMFGSRRRTLVSLLGIGGLTYMVVSGRWSLSPVWQQVNEGWGNDPFVTAGVILVGTAPLTMLWAIFGGGPSGGGSPTTVEYWEDTSYRTTHFDDD